MIKIKVEIEIPEDIYLFFSYKSAINKNSVSKEIINFLTRELNHLKKLSLEEILNL